MAETQAHVDAMCQMAGRPRLDLHVPEARPRAAPRKRSADGKPLERDILKAILQYLRLHPRVAFAGRFNRGAMVAGFRYVSFNSVAGFPDIHGLMADGRALYVEVKRPKGRVLAEQREFLAMAHDAGALVILARSVDDVIEALP